MPFRRWDPFFDLLTLHQELFGETTDTSLGDKSGGGWSPPVDIYETPHAFVIKLELAGVDPDKVKIEYRNRRLHVSGERLSHKDTSRKYHQMEMPSGPFEKTFAIPEKVDEEKMDAQYEDGLLEIMVPKTGPSEASRSIRIQSSE